MTVTSITYTQTLVNFRTTFEDDNRDDAYLISGTDVAAEITMSSIPISEENLRKGFATGNCSIESNLSIYPGTGDPLVGGDGVMISLIRAKLNAELVKTAVVPNKSVKQMLLEFINLQDDNLGSDKNRILWTELSYAFVKLASFASGLVDTDLALTTYDMVNDDIVNFIFRFSGGPRSVGNTLTSSLYYTVKIPFIITDAIGPPISGVSSADTPLQ